MFTKLLITVFSLTVGLFFTFFFLSNITAVLLMSLGASEFWLLKTNTHVILGLVETIAVEAWLLRSIWR